MGELTGRHVLAITAGAFAVVIGVNITLAYQAVATFPGLEVRNSYVASQTFDADRTAQQTLGWTLVSAYENGRLTLTFRDTAGLPAPVQSLTVLVGRATVSRDDIHPEFSRTGGQFATVLDLPPGKWLLQVEAMASDGTPFRQRLDLTVKG